MQQHEREHYAKQAALLHIQNKSGIRYMSITVRKENVQVHIRSDPNKLYNYMISLSLLNEMSKHENIIFMPDPRSIKIKSGNSLHDYLQTKLWFEKQAVTSINTNPITSSSSHNIQFADMLSGLVQSYFEDGNSRPWLLLRSHISYKTLFFWIKFLLRLFSRKTKIFSYFVELKRAILRQMVTKWSQFSKTAKAPVMQSLIN